MENGLAINISKVGFIHSTHDKRCWSPPVLEESPFWPHHSLSNVPKECSIGKKDQQLYLLQKSFLSMENWVLFKARFSGLLQRNSQATFFLCTQLKESDQCTSYRY